MPVMRKRIIAQRKGNLPANKNPLVGFVANAFMPKDLVVRRLRTIGTTSKSRMRPKAGASRPTSLKGSGSLLTPRKVPIGRASSDKRTN